MSNPYSQLKGIEERLQYKDMKLADELRKVIDSIVNHEYAEYFTHDQENLSALDWLTDLADSQDENSDKASIILWNLTMVMTEREVLNETITKLKEQLNELNSTATVKVDLESSSHMNKLSDHLNE